MRFLAFLLLALLADARADDPFLKPGDVIALVGGEDTVVASEIGYVETLLQKALPQHHLKFRSLAWEGDTYEKQRRDLNYPSLEVQLEKMGATVVLVYFSPGTIPTPSDNGGTVGDYLDRLKGPAGGVQRRLMIVYPTPVEDRPAFGLVAEPLNRRIQAFGGALATEVQGRRCASVMLDAGLERYALRDFTRDGVHLNELGQAIAARLVAADILADETNFREDGTYVPAEAELKRFPIAATPDETKMQQLIIEKNRLWFNYSRPQNWAFLAGDRTNQPSSRDHLDKNKRWFPEEMEKFLPLIDAKEQGNLGPSPRASKTK